MLKYSQSCFRVDLRLTRERERELELPQAFSCLTRKWSDLGVFDRWLLTLGEAISACLPIMHFKKPGCAAAVAAGKQLHPTVLASVPSTSNSQWYPLLL